MCLVADELGCEYAGALDESALRLLARFRDIERRGMRHASIRPDDGDSRWILQPRDTAAMQEESADALHNESNE